jgi:bifunctional UDP-N-acetylglucosamine pyrophosphorylase/glucosamine-1-phosphate N-acetyltransferase
MKVSQAIILAAGESSRFWPLNNRHKSLFKIVGRPLIWHTINGLKKFGIKSVVIVQGLSRDIEKELQFYQIPGVKISYIVQPKPLGSGDALWQARKLIKGPMVVLGAHKADVTNYLPQLLRKFNGRIVLAGVKTDFPWEFGMIDFKEKKVNRIVENPKKGKEPSDIKTSEIYIFPEKIIDCLSKTGKKEDSLINAINLLIRKEGADLIILEKEPISLKYPWNALDILKSAGLVKNDISAKAIIGKNVVLKEEVSIGKDTIIGDNTVINGPCFIGEGCRIGANNIIRGPVNLENGVVTGALFEIKNSVVQEGTHFHSGYVGDSIIGSNCRFGAGFITANRRIDRKNIKATVKNSKIDTGRTHLGAIVGSNTSFGIHAGTMPGTLIGHNSLIGPGTLVFKNIDSQKIFFTEFKGVIEK